MAINKPELPTEWLVGLTFALAVLGILLRARGRRLRRRRGLGQGRTVSLDRVTLTSHRHGLTGRPDRIVRFGGEIIIEEWKSSLRVQDSHRAQMGVYFLLVEEQMRSRPSHGFIVCGDGSRHRIDNDASLRAWVLRMVDEIRRARAAIEEPIPVRPRATQCRHCGQRENCDQALDA
ncbi:CRISPR-associated protein Cas4 [Singulisphaera sp. PoT]|uniref:CRISPR-associated protein Cas4 n=1 Tax=Singulisphaera sp. PoT TaxID=3411797 RepID=UPI003BF55691